MIKTFIDLFSGAGGLALGMERAGFKNIFSIDFDNDSCETYRKNFPKHRLLNEDITELTEQRIKDLIKNEDIDCIVGGPPCQGFSMAGNIGRKFIEDPRNHLFKEFLRVVKIVKPKFFMMENVARLYSHNNHETKNEILKSFESIGYKVNVKILCSADYFVPQIRNRVIFIGNRINVKNNFPEKLCKKYISIKEAISHLPKLHSGENSDIINHNAMNHTSDMLKKMSFIKDGGDRLEIPERIRPKKGDIRKYIKYSSKDPSITITGDMRKVFHYNQNRALTVRELACIQTFPDDFKFCGTSISQQQQVGNAVPVLMAEAIGIQIKRSINNIISQYPKVNFIGNKEKISSWISSKIPDDVNSIFDAFSGGASISYNFKRMGYQVFSNDVMNINYLISKSLVENSKNKLSNKDVNNILSGKPTKGFCYNHFSNKYFFEKESMEIDGYLKKINLIKNKNKKSLALVVLRKSMIRKMPYSRFNIPWEKIKQLRDEDFSYKKYKRKRAYHNKSIKEHFIDNFEEYNKAIFNNFKNNKSFNLCVFDAIDRINADLIYLDPPYSGTMNNYFSFYGIIDKMIDSNNSLKPFSNNFIDKKEIIFLFDKLFSYLFKYKYWLISYNNKSYPDKSMMLSLLKKYAGKVDIYERKFNYQLSGSKNKNTNREYLFYCQDIYNNGTLNLGL